MNHWSEKYVGRPYIDEQFDCADMAKLVQKEVFGREVDIPGSRDYAGKAGVAKVRAMVNQLERVKDDLIVRTDSPSEGDVVLMTGRGYNSHVGVYCVIGGDIYVLHAAQGYMQTVLTRMRDLTAHGLQLEGVYKWI